MYVASQEGHAAVVAHLLGAKGIDVNAAEEVSASLVPPAQGPGQFSALWNTSYLETT
jgi:hypothetical protein